MTNNRSKVLATMHFVVALVWLAVSLDFLLTALTYNRQQSFASPALTFDVENDESLATNLKTPFIISFTILFGLGWVCEGLSETLLLKNNRKNAVAVFYIPVAVLLLSFIGMTQVPHGFLEFGLNACGFVIVSGFYLRYSLISPEAATRLAGRN
jgi:hypothetical protein